MVAAGVKFGALVAGASAVVALLTAMLTLYSQAANIVDAKVVQAVRKDFAPVGTVVSSLLPPEEFAEATGETEGDSFSNRTWILADGREVLGTKYARLTGNRPVPDLRGMFLRGVDPSGDRLAGERQDYATALPQGNSFAAVASEAGQHSHEGGMTLSAVGDRYNAGGRDYLVANPSPTGAAGMHSHQIAISGGDDETRPVNVGVFYYVKIN